MKKKYDGYKAFDYLEKGTDYKAYKLAKKDRVDEYLIELTDAQQKRASTLVEKNIYISMHEHPVYFTDDLQEIFEFNREGRACAAYDALNECQFDIIFDNMMDGTCTITSKRGWKFLDVVSDIGMRTCDLMHQDNVELVLSIEDIERIKREGKTGVIWTLEGAAPLENEVERVEILYGLGVRSMGITYSESNALGNGIKEDFDGGLTKFGQEVVERMNKVGMLIDCSHCGPQTTMDTANFSKKPMVLSHTGARALWESKRLAHDEVLLTVAKNGGVIGVEAAPHTTITEHDNVHTVHSIMEHFEYLVKLVGIDHVSFGPDTLYGDHVELHHVFAKHLSTGDTKADVSKFDEVEYVKGFENPNEAAKNIVRYLVKANYSDEDIKKVMGGNTLRVLKESWYK